MTSLQFSRFTGPGEKCRFKALFSSFKRLFIKHKEIYPKDTFVAGRTVKINQRGGFMILLSLIKELYAKLVSEDTKLTLEFLEEKAELVFNHRNQWEKEIDEKIKTLPEDTQYEATKIVSEILASAGEKNEKK